MNQYYFQKKIYANELNISFDENFLKNFPRGLFETFFVENNKIEFLDEHLERLYSALIIFFQDHSLLFKIKEIRKELLGFIESQQKGTFRLRVNVWPQDNLLEFMFILSPYKRITKNFELDFFFESDEYFSSFFSQFKMIHNSGNLFLMSEAKKRNVDDLIRCSSEGWILETSKANIFVVFSNEIRTPPVEGILPGIMRSNLIKNYNVLEQKIHYKELRNAKSVFICNSLIGIQSVSNIGNFFISKGLNESSKSFF